MDDLFIYIIKVNVSLILFYLCYRLFFQRDTFWKLRRAYLLAGIVFSFVYPLISMSSWLVKQKPVMDAIAAIQLDELVVGTTAKPSVFTLENIAWFVFGTGVVVLLLRMLFQLVSILRWRFRGEKKELLGVNIIRLTEKITPFSFFKLIFINPNEHTNFETEQILAHELTHARQWHSVDVLVCSIQKAFCWINPASWLMEREIRQNLEFLADNQVLKTGVEPKKYQYHLLQLTYEPADNKLANLFNVSPIKKRIIMMNTKKTKKSALLKYALVVPMALAMLVVSNVQVLMASAKNLQNEFKLNNTEITQTDQIVQTKLAKTAKPVADKDGVYDVVETPPSFTGGEKALMKFLNENIKYPKSAQENNIQGKVILKFIVDETGKVVEPTVVNKVDPSLDAEAIRVISLMPNWMPGKQKGKNVKVRYFLPISFKLSGNDTKGSAAKKKVFETVDTPPKFPGGDQAIIKYLQENVKYPKSAQENNIQGKVTVSFIVDETGKVIEPTVERSVNPLLDAESIRVIEAMPAWEPGKQDGKAVSVRYYMPISFKLQSDKPDQVTGKDKNKIDNDALFILDGKVISVEEIKSIKTDDIDRIDVLKGETGVKLYGEKGRKGVVLITLKKL